MMDFSKRYNREEFVKFLQNDFLPEDDFLTETTEAKIQQETKYIKGITKLGASPSLRLAVYEARHTSTHDARVGLSKEIFRFMANKRERKALVLFVPEGNNANYRLSLISIDLVENEDGNVKRTYSNPRRYSYYLGEGIAYYTPNKYLNQAGRIKDAKDLTERFSVEVLTKAFYQELSDWYAWAVKEVRFPNQIDDPTDDDKYNAESTIRLVTRLIFVWFLKQKHLIPDEFFDEQYIANNLLIDFDPNLQTGLFKEKSRESKYYKAILQNLFFAMLNSPITQEGKNELSERHFRSGRGDYDNNKLMRYEALFKNPQLFVDLANKTVPFLNGGLFDCLDDKDNGNYIDGFSDRKEVQRSLIVPDFLFFGEEAGKNIDLSQWYGDKKKKKVSARGIIDILKRYNFTVEENTPFDQDVSLDPELLGKVFENLLASYNPETQTTARKQTGSFYTPREIVQYMVDESLVAHLKRIVGEELEAEYRKLLQYSDDEITLTDEQKNSIMQSLYECKILDPACGSGAFPVGILQQMVHILSRIDPNNERWKEMILKEAMKETESVYKDESDFEKEQRIQDIYRSFDEKLTNPDYARKLYLIENCIYGVDIQPIAIQISKLRFFISLVVDQHTTNDPTKNFGIRPLPNLEAKFVAANTLIPLEKSENNLGRTPEIIATEERLKEANHKIFNAKTVKTKRKWKERLNELRAELIQQLSDNGFFTDDAINQLASWNMFDQNASASFFDADWMFGIKNGFDIVIANPPYVFSRERLSREEKEFYKKMYTLTQFKINLYILFFEQGCALMKEKGCLSYIIPNNWLSLEKNSDMRKYLLQNCRDISIIQNYAGVFENASVDTLLLFCSRLGRPIIKYWTWEDKNQITLVSELCNSSFLETPNYIILQSPLDDNIHLHNIIELSSICNVRNGVQAYTVGEGTPICTETIKRKRLYHDTVKHDMTWIKYLDGVDVKRYNIGWSGQYIKYGKNLSRPRKPELFHGKRILVRQIPNSLPYCINAAYIDSHAINDNNSMIVQMLCSEYDIKYILGVLNSKCISWWFAKTFNKLSRKIFPQFKINELRKFPIPVANIEKQAKVIEIVNKIISSHILDADLNNQLDYIVFSLFELTYDEVKIIDPKTPITKEEYENIKI